MKTAFKALLYFILLTIYQALAFAVVTGYAIWFEDSFAPIMFVGGQFSMLFLQRIEKILENGGTK